MRDVSVRVPHRSYDWDGLRSSRGLIPRAVDPVTRATCDDVTVGATWGPRRSTITFLHTHYAALPIA